MKVVQINTVFPNGSTGKICKGILEKCQAEGVENYVAYAHNCTKTGKQTYEIEITSWLDHHIHNRLARLTMGIGQFSWLQTKLFLTKMDKMNPDLIHLHNLHGNFINLQLLFQYIKKKQIPVVWTLHDCWAFTGYCAYYNMVKCDRWKKQCFNCPNRYQDSVTQMDRSKKMFHHKKKMFSDLDNLTLVTPSGWLKHEVQQSFLKDYPIRVINNGIDLQVFRPSEGNLKAKHQINNNHFVILGVANVWEKRKGLDVFLELSKRLGMEYKIVLVGTNEAIDKILPENILSIHRTRDQGELAEIYSSANVFVNPTLEDNFPTVNLEAIACGTPVVTFATGGSAEMLDETCGSVVAQGDLDALEREIVRICNTQPYTQEACLKRASRYDMNDRFQEYIDLYKEILSD